MKPIRTALTLLALALVVSASMGQQINGETKVKRDKLVRLTADGVPDGAASFWDYDDELIDAEEAPGKLTFAAAPGSYPIKLRVLLFSNGKVVSQKTVKVRVTIYEDAPPTPPDPPTPPTPPAPVDTLAKDLQAAFAADPGTNKAADLAALAALYRKADLLLGQSSVKTLADLQAALIDARRALIADDSLTGVRKRLQTELATLGTSATTPIDANIKAQAKAVFAKIADALGAVRRAKK